MYPNYDSESLTSCPFGTENSYENEDSTLREDVPSSKSKTLKNAHASTVRNGLKNLAPILKGGLTMEQLKQERKDEAKHEEIENMFYQACDNQDVKTVRRLIKRNPHLHNLESRDLNEEHPINTFRFTKRDGKLTLASDKSYHPDNSYRDLLRKPVRDDLTRGYHVSQPCWYENVNDLPIRGTETLSSCPCGTETPLDRSDELIDTVNKIINEIKIFHHVLDNTIPNYREMVAIAQRSLNL